MLGDAFPIQLIITHQLSQEHNYWLQNLRKDLKAGGEIRELVENYEMKKMSGLYQAVMDVILRANWKETEAEKRMCEALRELFAEELKEMEERGIEQGMERGMEQGMERGMEQGMKRGMQQGELLGIELAKKVFRLSAGNIPIPQIAVECGITEEKVRNILA